MKGGILNALKSRIDRNRLGELLVFSGLITPAQLRYALVRQRATQTPLGRVLIQEQLIRREQLYRALAQQMTFRVLTAAFTITLSLTAFAPKAKAGTIRDVPAAMSLVNVANSAFAPVQQYPSLFGSEERKSGNLKPFTKWTQMFDRFEANINTTNGQQVISYLQGDLRTLQGQSLKSMAEGVNAIVNRSEYIEDKNNYGVSDYWATPVEFLNRGGDCEDFAIAKYASLRALGVPEERMRIAIVHDIQKNIPHAILIVYADEGAMILDNQTKEARMADAVSRYRPIFSINREGWWLHTKPKDTVMASIQ